MRRERGVFQELGVRSDRRSHRKRAAAGAMECAAWSHRLRPPILLSTVMVHDLPGSSYHPEGRARLIRFPGQPVLQKRKRTDSRSTTDSRSAGRPVYETAYH